MKSTNEFQTAEIGRESSHKKGKGNKARFPVANALSYLTEEHSHRETGSNHHLMGTMALIILASIQQYLVNASLRIMNQGQLLFGLGACNNVKVIDTEK